MPLDGTYRTRIRAEGRTREGEVFTREQIVVPYMVSWGDIEVPAPPPPPSPVS
jgi:hypothetical protein